MQMSSKIHSVWTNSAYESFSLMLFQPNQLKHNLWLVPDVHLPVYYNLSQIIISVNERFNYVLQLFENQEIKSLV